MDGRLLEIGEIHGDLGHAAHNESRALYKTQSSARKANCLGNVFRNLDIRRAEKNVVSDKRFARADRCDPSRRMYSCIAEVRLPGRIGRDLGTDAFELPAANGFQVVPLRSCCGGL